MSITKTGNMCNPDMALDDLVDWMIMWSDRFYQSSQAIGPDIPDAAGLWVRNGEHACEPFDGRIAISRHLLPALLNSLGYLDKAIIEKWKLKGWLLSTPQGFTPKILCHGEKWSCYVLTKEALAPYWGPADENPTT